MMHNAPIVIVSPPYQRIPLCRHELMFTRIIPASQRCYCDCQAHSLSTFAAQSTDSP